MKRLQLLAALIAVATWILMPSCGSNSEKDTALQPPETTQAADQQEAVIAEDEAEENEAEENEGKDGKTNSNAKMATVDNLVSAFKGESTASAKYAAYAKKAKEEGFTQIAILFKAASASEKIHAANHKAVLDEMGETTPEIKPEFVVKTTMENLDDAITGESYEITTMYPEFIATATSAANDLAETSMKYALKTEKKHKVLYERAKAALQDNQLKSLSMQYYVCPTCGNTYDTNAPKRCRISMTSSDKFISINAI